MVFVLAVPVQPGSMLLLILGIGFGYGWLVRGAILRWRDAINLRQLANFIEAHPVERVYRVRDYFPEGLHARPGEAPPDADWTILHVRRVQPTAYQTDIRSSFILFGIAPPLTAMQRFGLLHEMGHIGWRNYLTATTEARYKQLGPVRRPLDLDGRNGLVLRRVWLVVTRPRFARAFFAALFQRPTPLWFGITAMAPLVIFMPHSSLAAALIPPFLIFFGGSLNGAGLRREAEIGADYFAVRQLMLGEIGEAGFLAPRHPLTAEGFVLPRDRDLSDDDHALRVGAFEWMRIDAADNLVVTNFGPASAGATSQESRPGWFFAWRFAGLQQAASTVIRLLILAGVTGGLWFAGTRPEAGAFQMIALVPALAAFLFAATVKARRMRAVRALLPATP